MSGENGNGKNNLQQLIENVKRLITLHLDYARLTATEKLTIILSTMAIYAVVVVFATLSLVFITLGIGHLLATTIAPHFAYLIMAGFYIIALVVLFLLRKQLFVNPIARFLSKLFVNPPEKD